MYAEDDLLALSGLQHLAYCPRQWALIHLEQTWGENRFTAEGNLLHRRSDSAPGESRGELYVARSLRLHSYRLGLTGIADVVEFHRDPAGVTLPSHQGRWRPYPVEYKRGGPKEGEFDRVQLCAQALCLEEMLHTTVVEGSLYYGKTRRRVRVSIDEPLRARTTELAAQLHRMWESGQTPPPEYGPRCERCSLLEQCQPRSLNRQRASAWLQHALDANRSEDAS